MALVHNVTWSGASLLIDMRAQFNINNYVNTVIDNIPRHQHMISFKCQWELFVGYGFIRASKACGACFICLSV